MEDGRVCSECGQQIHAGDKFCPECGHKVEVVEIVADDAPTEVLEETDEPAPEPKGRSRRPFLIAGVAAIGLILAGAAWWGLTQNSAAKDQYAASGPALMSDLQDMAGVQTTEMVQDVGGSAQEQVTTIDATLQQDPQAKGADRLTTLRDAFVALSALQGYDEANTQVWIENREPLLDRLGVLTTYGGQMQDVMAAGEDGARALDALTAKVDKAMARYRKRVARARAAAKSRRAEVRDYHRRMEALIDRYTALRNDTGAFVDRMAQEQMYMFEIIEYFTRAATDRRDVANQMAALTPPPSMRGVHAPVVTAVGDGADAIDAGVAALEDADCFDDECYFTYDTQWEQFETESDRITALYGQAYAAWQGAMAQTLDDAKGANLPPRPDL